MADLGVAREQLRAFVERIERLEEEKKQIADDIKEVYSEAKGNGYDVKVLRKLISLRKKDANERAEEESILELYMQALGMLNDETRAKLKAADARGKEMVAEFERLVESAEAAKTDA